MEVRGLEFGPPKPTVLLDVIVRKRRKFSFMFFSRKKLFRWVQGRVVELGHEFIVKMASEIVTQNGGSVKNHKKASAHTLIKKRAGNTEKP